MNKNTKNVVYELLATDEQARKDDWYLIEKVACKMAGTNEYTPFTKIMDLLRKKGISFESITRHRRKFLELNPELNPDNIKKLREDEEILYHDEFSKHIPSLY